MSWKDQFPKDNRYFETDNGILYCGDCLEIMKEFPEKSVDLVLTDPPYGYKKVDRKINVYYKDVSEFLKWIKNIILLAHISLKNTGTLTIFSNYKNNYKIRFLLDEIFEENNFLNEIVWCYKVGNFTKKIPFSQKHDTIYIYKKGENVFFRLLKDKRGSRIKSWWVIDSIADKSGFFKKDNEYKVLTPYQKPIILFERFINALSNENNLVLDPFLGSGTTAVACEKLNRRWIGIELEEKYCEIAKKRIIKAREWRETLLF